MTWTLDIDLAPDEAERFLLDCFRDGLEPSEVVAEVVACLASEPGARFGTGDLVRAYYRDLAEARQQGQHIGFGRWLDRSGLLDEAVACLDNRAGLDQLYREYMGQPEATQGMSAGGAVSDLLAYISDRLRIKGEVARWEEQEPRWNR